MALKKKNVFQNFSVEDYVPTGDQQIVKYIMGKGNNLHEVEGPFPSSTFLVTMPKKYRGTVWLKKGDCLVIDPIQEGKKVLGEIVYLIPAQCVVDMLTSGQWIPKQQAIQDQGSLGGGGGDFSSPEEWKQTLITFFTAPNKNPTAEEGDSTMPPSDSEESEQEESEEDEEEEEKVALEVEEEEGYKSRVQFLTSGIVTVTNVVNDMSSLNLLDHHHCDLQSLDFETDDSSLESNQKSASASSGVHRAANTIRIQVNYPPQDTRHHSS